MGASERKIAMSSARIIVVAVLVSCALRVASAAELDTHVRVSQSDLIGAVAFPDGWWGWSGKEGEAVDDNDGFFAGSDGALYVWTTDGSPGVSGEGRGPDLTSPFFAGRTNIVPVDQKTVFDTTFFTYKMDFENHNYDPPDSALEKVLIDMRAVLVEATRRQAAQRP